MTALVAAVLVLVTAGIVASINYINWRNISREAEAALEILSTNSGVRPIVLRDDKRDDQGGHDVDYDYVSDSVGYISPVPGGIGPMTIASLMYNSSKIYQ